MSLAVLQAEFFKQDFANQFGWYVDEAGPELARRFQSAIDHSLSRLARRPDLGRTRRFRNARLRGLRSFQVERPFNKLLIFYRVSGDTLEAVRLMHSARDLPRRLVEAPGSSGDRGVQSWKSAELSASPGLTTTDVGGHRRGNELLDKLIHLHLFEW